MSWYYSTCVICAIICLSAINIKINIDLRLTRRAYGCSFNRTSSWTEVQMCWAYSTSTVYVVPHHCTLLLLRVPHSDQINMKHFSKRGFNHETHWSTRSAIWQSQLSHNHFILLHTGVVIRENVVLIILDPTLNKIVAKGGLESLTDIEHV